MSAAAGALGCRLEKPGHYVLGADGRLPSAATILASVALARTASALAFGAYVAWAAAAQRVGETARRTLADRGHAR